MENTLPNRTLFADRFSQAVAHSKRTKTILATCFLDIDNFKPINDKFGHETGDQLLIEVAQRIKSCIRNEDTVSRQGGDEFTLLLGDLKSYEEVEIILERMLLSLSQPYLIGDRKHEVTASCGITQYPRDDGDLDTLLRHSDQAMYQAKLEGKNSFRFFDSDTEKSSRDRHNFLKCISKAIELDELVLFYQPKMNMRSGEIIGAEALIRWQHPERGLLAPIEFLPQIENTHVMLEVGKWVTEKALRQVDLWHKQGQNWSVSINIDAYHFMQPGFLTDLKQALAQHPDLPAKKLEIEILETLAFEDLSRVSTLIRNCQALGVTFALDDFGTGYSSLSYLKSIPADWLKIDQSFVRDMLEDHEDKALIEGIIFLSKVFKRRVIAEGVETSEHGVALMKLGCDYAQGYGIAKPMPAENMISWAKNYIHDQLWII